MSANSTAAGEAAAREEAAKILMNLPELQVLFIDNTAFLQCCSAAAAAAASIVCLDC